MPTHYDLIATSSLNAIALRPITATFVRVVHHLRQPHPARNVVTSLSPRLMRRPTATMYLPPTVGASAAFLPSSPLVPLFFSRVPLSPSTTTHRLWLQPVYAPCPLQRIHRPRRRCRCRIRPPCVVQQPRRAVLSPPRASADGGGDEVNEGANAEAQAEVTRLVESVSAFDGSPAAARSHTTDILNRVCSMPNDVIITPVYKALHDAARIPSFGVVTRQLPSPATGTTTTASYLTTAAPSLREKAALAADLPKLTGLPLSSLTPRRAPQLVLQLALISSLSLLAYASRTMHLAGVVRPLVYVSLSLLTADQILLRGAVSDLVYSAVNPRHARRVATHEAGHFLLAYLHGLPVQRYVLTTRDAIAARIPGQAATLFADDEFSAQLREGRVAQRVVDRYCVVAMAGIAAEALVFGEAVGGDEDVEGVIRLLGELKPPWEGTAVRVQARWAVLSAVRVLRKYRGAFEELREAMANRSPLGECVLKIEDAIAAMGEEDGGGVDVAVGVRKEKVEEPEVEANAAEQVWTELDRREARVDEELERLEREMRAKDPDSAR